MLRLPKISDSSVVSDYFGFTIEPASILSRFKAIKFNVKVHPLQGANSEKNPILLKRGVSRIYQREKIFVINATITLTEDL